MEDRYKAVLSRAAAAVLSFTILLCVLAGCSKNSQDAAGDPQDQAENSTSQSIKRGAEGTITIWTWDENFNIKAARMAAEQCGGAFEGRKIEIVPMERDDVLTTTENLLAAGSYDSLPEIIMVEDYDAQELLAGHRDQFLELTDYVEAGKYTDSKRSNCSWKKGDRELLYGLPFDSGTAALFYRLDILEQAGLSEKDLQDLTWEEFIQIGRVVREKTGKAMLTLDPTDMPLLRLIMQSCGRWYVDEEGEADISNNGPLKIGLEITERLLAEDLGLSVNGWNEFITAFHSGDVACVLTGSWIISSITAAEDQKGLWRVAAVPCLEEYSKKGETASNIGGSAWYVLKNSKEAEAAADFLTTMFGKDDSFMDRVIQEVGVIPAVRDPSVYKSYNSPSAFFGGQKINALLTEYSDHVPVVNYGYRTYDIEGIVEAEFQRALSDGDYDGALKRAQSKADAMVRN